MQLQCILVLLLPVAATIVRPYGEWIRFSIHCLHSLDIAPFLYLTSFIENIIFDNFDSIIKNKSLRVKHMPVDAIIPLPYLSPLLKKTHCIIAVGQELLFKFFYPTPISLVSVCQTLYA